MILYKYLPPERVDVLEKLLIRFTQPAAFNDPFDCRPSPRSRGDVAYSQPDTDDCCIDAHVYCVQEMAWLQGRRDMGVLCLSENSKSLLMWTHYAKFHEGFLIAFDTDNQFFAKREDGTGLWKVKYTKDRPAFPRSVVEKALSDQLPVHSLGLTSLYVLKSPAFNPDMEPEDYRFIKSAEWEYEQEWRLIRRLDNPDLSVPLGDLLPACMLRFPSEAVKSVILGVKAVSKLYPKVRAILDGNPSYSHVKVSICMLDSGLYELNTRPFNPPIGEVDETTRKNMSEYDLVDYLHANGCLEPLDEVEGLRDMNDE